MEKITTRSFKKLISENGSSVNARDLSEATHVSFHTRTPTQMAVLHKDILQKSGHKIVSHETAGDGSHTIHHISPSKKVRVSTISPVHAGRKNHNAKITDRPGTPEENEKHGIRK